MSSLDQLRRIAEVEFANMVVQADTLGAKLRVLLTDTSYVDVWVSRKLRGRFDFHWERRHLDGRTYRYDNFPDGTTDPLTCLLRYVLFCAIIPVQDTPAWQGLIAGP